MKHGMRTVTVLSSAARRFTVRAATAFVCLSASACSPKPANEPSEASEARLLPSRVRVLSNAELGRAGTAVLGAPAELAGKLAPEVRQAGYTRNADQPWLPNSAVRWETVSAEWVARVVAAKPTALFPCGVSSASNCRADAIQRWAQNAWRRPPTSSESEQLQHVFALGAKEGGEWGGVALVLTTLLQSPSFLYQTELGHLEASGERVLQPFEIASALAFTLSGAPPDTELLAAAADGTLREPSVRAAQARRILSQAATRYHFQRFVLEWLEVDRLEDSAKDAELFPAFEELKGPMLQETASFTDQVFITRGASVRDFLTAGFASVDARMARYYGLKAFGAEAPLAGTARIGVLQQASVLAAHSHPDMTSPVKRGDFVLRQLLCKQLPRPGELGIEVVMPQPLPNETTEQRLARHSSDPSCMYCHRQIDPFGMLFENFDAAGKQTARATQSAAIETHLDAESAALSDSLALARWLAERADVSQCFARQAFRYFSAQSDARVEATFMRWLAEQPEAAQTNLIEMLVAYTQSDLFVRRRASDAS